MLFSSWTLPVRGFAALPSGDLVSATRRRTWGVSTAAPCAAATAPRRHPRHPGRSERAGAMHGPRGHRRGRSCTAAVPRRGPSRGPGRWA